MRNKKGISKGNLPIIDEIGKTSDTLSSRGGLSLFVRYFRNIGFAPHIERLFGTIRKNRKGQCVAEIFKQLICNFIDGTSRHLVYFDSLKGDAGYAGTIESREGSMLSSHAVKRFYNSFSWYRIWLFRYLLQELFIWRLNLKKPDVVELFIDTLVMDNDEAKKRHGVQPTYKDKNGFQPLQMIWGRFIIDTVFRGGKKHSNYGNTVENMVCHMVEKIRKKYRKDVPVIIKMDSGFFDQKLFAVFERLEIGYICSGKMYTDIRNYAGKVDDASWKHYRNKHQVWDYVEFMDKRGSWSQSRRAIYCRPFYDGIQQVIDFAREDTILYTNMGIGQKIDNLLAKVGQLKLLHAEKIIECTHSRGRDELVHRALKDFGSEELPFKKFAPNAAYYYTMVLAFFLFETFKEDVCSSVVSVTAYAVTIRRRIIDCAAKIVKTGGKIIIKVTSATWNALKIDVLWKKSGSPPQFV